MALPKLPKRLLTTLQRLAKVANSFVAKAAHWASGLPGGPLKDVLAGALLLVQRGLTNAIRAVNSAPTLTGTTVGEPDPASGAVAFTVTVVDAEGDTVVYSAAPTARGQVRVIGSGQFVYTPTEDTRHRAAADDATAGDLTDSVTVTADDGQGGRRVVAVAVEISPANSAPTAVAPDLRGLVLDPDTGTLTGAVAGSDADTDTLTFALVGDPAKGAATVSPDGTFSYTPTPTARHAAAADGAPAEDLQDALVVAVADGHGGSTSVSVGVKVVPANQAPTATASVGEPDSSGVVTGEVSATDPDEDPLSYSGSVTTAKGTATVDAGTGAFTYTPTDAARSAAVGGGDAASDTFTVTVSDGHGAATEVPVTVAIAAPAVQLPTSFTVRTAAKNSLAADKIHAVYAVGSTIYAATDSGLSISTDGGATFTTRTTADGLAGGFRNSPEKVDGVFVVDSTVYAASYGGLAVSTDGGTTFSKISGLAATGGVYATGSTVCAWTGSGLIVSTDGGKNFTTRTTANGLGSNYGEAVFVSGGTIYAATSKSGLGISTDGGATFTTRTTSDGLGSNEMYGVTVVDNTIYVATWGGLSISTDGGVTFTNRTTKDGLASNALRRVVVSDGVVYAGIWGAGLSVSVDGGKTFGTTFTTRKGGLASDYVYSLFVDDGTVYTSAGFGGGGLSISN